MTVSRRTFLAGGTAAGALLVGGGGALAAPLGGVAAGPSRASRLFPGTRLAHADLHNHTLYSDGAGDPALAFASMRDAGLDVAALTDHATVAKALPAQAAELACTGPEGCGLVGIDEGKWQASRGLADQTNRDGSFASIRGFEWSSPTLGHMNVWFSETWIDPASTGGNTTGEGLGQFAHDIPGLGPAISGPLDEAVRALPTTGTGMRLFHDWLAADPARPVLGGGADAIFGFNHPGREPGRFGYFTYDERLQQRLVSLEVFNRGEDYLFEGTDAGFASPLPECLDAGWKVGLLGVTDEHGTDWGYPDGKGRTGLWVKALTRAGVREAMEARRFFSTRLRGLRVDASMNGARMGSTVGLRSGAATFALDLDRGPAFYGKKLVVQVLQTGRPLPTVVAQRTVTVPRPSQPVVRFTVPLDVADGRWVVLRICDPSQKADGRATTAAYTTAGNAIAYTSPFFLDPDRAAAAAAALRSAGRPAGPGAG
ncbi:MAG: hypothetical protein Q8R60_07620 [Mycobacteriales bacterium]|nr:hypothetical protein [Mycobacteriales bacterium]